MRAHTKNLSELIEERSIPEPNTGCWIWIFGLNSSGYGSITYQGNQMGAHRASYVAFNGLIPEKFDVHHVCNNRFCVNPYHLKAVTHSENMSAQGPRARKDFCKNGHALSADNVYEWNGNRGCRICRAEADKKYKAKKIAVRY